MNSGFTLKSFAVCFAVVVVFYLGVFHGIEHWRQKKGPWEVSFTADAQGQPAVVASQPGLKISNVTLVFLEEQVPQTNLPQRIRFDRPLKPVPFGRKLYEDLTVLPGVVTFDFFGHEIELLPRVLIINRREIPWQSGRTLELAATNKLLLPPRR